MGAVKQLTSYYRYYFHELADPRTHKWPMITNPLPTLTIIAIYTLLVFLILPKFMKNRHAFSLKTTIIIYNFFQIVTCLYLVLQAFTPLYDPKLSFWCEPLDISPSNEKSSLTLNLCYCFYFLKGSELLETIFFVLRKKQNQVSMLHVYHHVSTFFIAWLYTRYFGGGMTMFVFTTNSIIHIFMYSYYLASSLGVSWQKRTAKWKSKLTIAQIVQLCVLVLGASQTFTNCGVSYFFTFAFVPNILVNLKLFWDFYKATYSKSSAEKKLIGKTG